MKLILTNATARVSDWEFREVVHAIERQVHEDFAELWGIDATIRSIRAQIEPGRRINPEALDGDAIVYVCDFRVDQESVKDALGYHDLNMRGIPYGFVFTDLARKTGENWTVTLSHEVLELLADPQANRLAMGLDPRKKGSRRNVLRSYEVCDPVQEDSYVIDGVAVSNFVTPDYFSSVVRKDGLRLDFLRRLKRPWSITAGGYIAFLDPRTMRWSQWTGKRAETDARLAEKKAMGDARRQRRRELLVQSRPLRRTAPIKSPEPSKESPALGVRGVPPFVLRSGGGPIGPDFGEGGDDSGGDPDVPGLTSGGGPIRPRLASGGGPIRPKRSSSGGPVSPRAQNHRAKSKSPRR